MARPASPSNLDLRTLWAEYKAICGRSLPDRAAGFVQGRQFDRLLIAYTVSGLVAAGALALALAMGPELLHGLPDWSLPEASAPRTP